MQGRGSYTRRNVTVRFKRKTQSYRKNFTIIWRISTKLVNQSSSFRSRRMPSNQMGQQRLDVERSPRTYDHPRRHSFQIQRSTTTDDRPCHCFDPSCLHLRYFGANSRARVSDERMFIDSTEPGPSQFNFSPVDDARNVGEDATGLLA